MALTVGVGTVLESREVVVVVTGQRKAVALSKAIEEGINHLVNQSLIFSRIYAESYCQWTLSALQQHPWALIVVDEDATLGMFVSHMLLPVLIHAPNKRTSRQDREILQVY